VESLKKAKAGNHRLKHELEFIFLLLTLFGLWYSTRSYHPDAEAIQQSLKNLPIFYSGIIYIVLYVVVTFFIFFSKDVFWVTGAVLFGAGLSTLFICIAEVINAFILFHLARSFGRGYVEKKVSIKYKELDERLGKVNFFWLFLFRAAPLIPYRFMDLAAGLTSINFRRYILVVILGSPFKMFWVQYILTGVGRNIFRNPEALVGYFLHNKTLLMFSLIYPVLVIAVTYKLTHKDRK